MSTKPTNEHPAQTLMVKLAHSSNAKWLLDQCVQASAQLSRDRGNIEKQEILQTAVYYWVYCALENRRLQVDDTDVKFDRLLHGNLETESLGIVGGSLRKTMTGEALRHGYFINALQNVCRSHASAINDKHTTHQNIETVSETATGMNMPAEMVRGETHSSRLERAVEKHTASLPDKFQRPLRLFTAGHTMKEIAHYLNCTPQTVKNDLSAARSRLKTSLQMSGALASDSYVNAISEERVKKAGHRAK